MGTISGMVKGIEIDDEIFYSPGNVADILKMSRRTIDGWRSRPDYNGLKFIRVGTNKKPRILYRHKDLVQFLYGVKKDQGPMVLAYEMPRPDYIRLTRPSKTGRTVSPGKKEPTRRINVEEAFERLAELKAQFVKKAPAPQPKR